MSVSVIIKWGGQEYSISSLSEEDTVMDLKQSIKTLTGVLPERQKLLGLKVKGERASVVTSVLYMEELDTQDFISLSAFALVLIRLYMRHFCSLLVHVHH